MACEPQPSSHMNRFIGDGGLQYIDNRVVLMRYLHFLDLPKKTLWGLFRLGIFEYRLSLGSCKIIFISLLFFLFSFVFGDLLGLSIFLYLLHVILLLSSLFYLLFPLCLFLLLVSLSSWCLCGLCDVIVVGRCFLCVLRF